MFYLVTKSKRKFQLLVKKRLIRAVIRPLGPDHRILESFEPGLLPLVPDEGTMELAAPAAPQDGGSVVGVVPHEVEVLVGVDPLVDGGDLPRVQSTVEVSGHVGVHLNHRPGSSLLFIVIVKLIV